LNKGLRLIFIDQIEGKEKEFHHKGGIADFVRNINKNKDVLHNEPFYFNTTKDDIIIEVAIQYHSGYVENIYSYVNNIHTQEGGTHETGFKTAMTRVVNDYARRFGRGIYGLETWFRGIRSLPGSFEVPQYFKVLGFTEIPEGPEDVRQRYQTLTSQLPSDGKEKDVKLEQLKNAAEDALHYFRENRSNLQ
jgi:hypothetical protein